MLLQPFRDTNGLLAAVPLPDLVLLRQRFPRPRIADVSAAVIAALESVRAKIRPGARIAIGVGSRGVADIVPVVVTLVATLRRYGAEPFIIPAMGSHGGATPEGQLAVLASLGITEQALGVPIVSSLDVDVLGKLPNGMPVYIDRAAHAADGIILVNRVKPHTDFDAEIESGLSKMVAIGLCKHAGALEVHAWGVEGLTTHMPEVAKFVAAHASLLCGLATVENGYDEVAEVATILPEGIANESERALLRRAKELMPRLPWDALDVLVIDEMGKNVSGAGMDPNIIGRMRAADQQKPTAARITNITVHNLTDESHGNAIGLGNADFTTARLVEKLDLQALYINSLTAGVIALNSCKIPLVLPDDRSAIQAAIRSCGRADPTRVRLARIENTLRLEYILASVQSLEHLRPAADVEVLGPAMPFSFEPDGAPTPFASLARAEV